VTARGWPVARRSELPRERQPGAVIVLDTVGELAQLYGIADVVFVGGSLVAAGGHNMLEPAQRRKPVLFGPYTTNFREAGARLVHGWERGLTPPAAAVLGTLAGGYRRFLGAREWLYEQGVLRSRGLGRPVIAIGNLTVGGTGKTPAVEMAVQTLLELGHRPVVVSRGYRRQSRGVQIVADTSSVRLDAEEAGDEPFL